MEQHNWHKDEYKKVTIYECQKCGSMLIIKKGQSLPQFPCVPTEPVTKNGKTP